MQPSKDKSRKSARQEFETARDNKELPRPLQRKLLQKRFADRGDRAASAASHGEEVSPEPNFVSPREDRAG